MFYAVAVGAAMPWWSLSAELWVAAATFSLAGVTIGVVLVSWLTERRRRALDLIRRQLDEYYFPLIERFRKDPTSETVGTEDDSERIYNDVRRILVTRRYLAGPEAAAVMPLDLDDIGLYSNGSWIPTNKVSKEAWSARLNTLRDEALALSARYLKLSGTRSGPKSLPVDWAIDLAADEEKQRFDAALDEFAMHSNLGKEKSDPH